MTADGSYGESADVAFEGSDVIGAAVVADVTGADGAAGSGSTSTPRL